MPGEEPSRKGEAGIGAPRAPVLHWMIFTGISLFGFVLLWRFGFVRRMIESDITFISPAILVIYLGTTLHCLWRTIAVSREQEAARRAAALVAGGGELKVVGGNVEVEGAGPLPHGLIAAHIRNLALKAARQGARLTDQTTLLRSLAARLRGSNHFGAFASDLAMKLGLVGTIIGFIIMLAPIGGLDPSDQATIKSSMNLMSDGMAVAMYTTLVGLGASILIRIQYYMLENVTAKLFAFAVTFTDVYVIADPRAKLSA